MRLCLYRLALISASWCLIQYPSIPRINDEFLVEACPSKSTTERMRLILHINTSHFSAVLPNPIVFQLYLKNLLNRSCSKGVLRAFMSSGLPFHQKAPGSSLCLPSRERQIPSRKRPGNVQETSYDLCNSFQYGLMSVYMKKSTPESFTL
jgi:hypothetical protein